MAQVLGTGFQRELTPVPEGHFMEPKSLRVLAITGAKQTPAGGRLRKRHSDPFALSWCQH